MDQMVVLVFSWMQTHEVDRILEDVVIVVAAAPDMEIC